VKFEEEGGLERTSSMVGWGADHVWRLGLGFGCSGGGKEGGRSSEREGSSGVTDALVEGVDAAGWWAISSKENWDWGRRR